LKLWRSVHPEWKKVVCPQIEIHLDFIPNFYYNHERERIMDLSKIEEYWIASSEDDMETSKVLFENKKYVQSMFFLHLTIEKMLKALFVRKNNCEAPIGHNLQTLAKKISDVPFKKEHFETFSKITTFNIAARYDDYKRNFYKICTVDFAANYLSIGQELIQWLKSLMK
jgi:HEPN domain-containing protein